MCTYIHWCWHLRSPIISINETEDDSVMAMMNGSHLRTGTIIVLVKPHLPEIGKQNKKTIQNKQGLAISNLHQTECATTPDLLGNAMMANELPIPL